MVGPLLRHLKLDLVETYFTPDGNFPGHEPNPLLPENRAVHHRQGHRGGRRPRHRLGRRRRPLLLHRRHGRVRRRRLPHRAARRVAAGEGPAVDDPLRRARLAGRVPRTVERLGGTRAAQPRRARVLQDAHARGGRGLRRRGQRPLLLPRLLLRGLGHDPRAADARAALDERQAPQRAARALPLDVLHLRRDQLRRSTTPTAKMAEIAARYAAQGAEIGHLDGVSVDFDDWHFNVRSSNTEPLLRLCLESLVSVRGHGAPARRGPRADPLVTRAAAAPLAGTRRASRRARPSRRASTASRSRRRSPSGGSTST